MSTSDIVEEDQLLLVNRLLPQEVGLFKHKVVHTCLDATEVHLAVGSEQGNFWVVDMKARRMLLKEVTVSNCISRAHFLLELAYFDTDFLLVSGFSRTSL